MFEKTIKLKPGEVVEIKLDPRRGWCYYIHKSRRFFSHKGPYKIREGDTLYIIRTDYAPFFVSLTPQKAFTWNRILIKKNNFLSLSLLNENYVSYKEYSESEFEKIVIAYDKDTFEKMQQRQKQLYKNNKIQKQIENKTKYLPLDYQFMQERQKQINKEMKKYAKIHLKTGEQVVVDLQKGEVFHLKRNRQSEEIEGMEITITGSFFRRSHLLVEYESKSNGVRELLSDGIGEVIIKRVSENGKNYIIVCCTKPGKQEFSFEIGEPGEITIRLPESAKEKSRVLEDVLSENLRINHFLFDIVLFAIIYFLNSRLGGPIGGFLIAGLGLLNILIDAVVTYLKAGKNMAENYEGYPYSPNFPEDFYFPTTYAFIFLVAMFLIVIFTQNLMLVAIAGFIFLIILTVVNGISIKPLVIISVIFLFLYGAMILFRNYVTIPNILFLFIYSIYLLACIFDSPGNKIIFGGILAFYLLIGYPILNAWVPIVSAKVASTTTTMGINYHITQNESFFGYLMRHANETWLILTNPQEYYKEQFLKESGKREKGVNSMAVLLNKVSVLPINAFPSTKDDNETTTLMLSFSNEGDQKATDVIYGVDLGKSAIENGAAIENSSNYLEGIRAIDYVPELIPGERMLESFQILTPFCSGTYSGTAFIQYQYPVYAYLNLEFMDKSYYMELLKRKIITGTEKATSYCSAGPVKLVIATNKFQPIPVDTNQNQLTMTFYITLQNTQDGHAMLRDLELYFPKGVTFDRTNSHGDICFENNVCFKEEDSNPSYTILKLDTSRLNSGKFCLNPNQMQVFPCTVTFKFKQHPMPIKTLTIKANVTYIYRYYRSFSFNVINTPEIKFKKGGCNAILNNEDIRRIIHARQNPNVMQTNVEKDVCGKNNPNCYYYTGINSNKNILVLGYSDIASNKEKIKQEILSAIFESMSEQNPHNLIIILFSPQCDESVLIRNEDILEHKQAFLKQETTSNEKEIAFLKSSKIILNEEPLQISPRYIYTLTFNQVKGKCGIFNLYIISADAKPLKGVVCDLGQGAPCVDNSQCAPGFSCLSIYDYLAYKSSLKKTFSPSPYSTTYYILFGPDSSYYQPFNHVYTTISNYLPEDLKLQIQEGVTSLLTKYPYAFFCYTILSTDNSNLKLDYNNYFSKISNWKDSLNDIKSTKFWNETFKLYSHIYSGRSNNALVQVYISPNGNNPTKIWLPAGVCRPQECFNPGEGEYSQNFPLCNCHKTFNVPNSGLRKCERVCNVGMLNINEMPCVCEYLSAKKNIKSGKFPPHKYLYFENYFENYFYSVSFLPIFLNDQDFENYAEPINGNYVCDQNHLSNVVYACCLVNYSADDGPFLRPVKLVLKCQQKEVTNSDGTTKTYHYWALFSQPQIYSNKEKLSYINTCSSESSTSDICVDNDGSLRKGRNYVTTLSSTENICQELIKKKYLFKGTSS